MQSDVVIIGGGIHGLTSAIALAEDNVDVVLLEKNSELFKGTSGATHNRGHKGYHYPQSLKTARECEKGIRYFEENFAEALHWPKETYYLIAKEGSQSTEDEYEHFCRQHGIGYEIKWPAPDFILRDSVIRPFYVREPVYDTRRLCSILEKKAVDNGVRIKKDATVIGASRSDAGSYKIVTKEGNNQKEYSSKIVVNATYTCANNILKLFGLEKYMTKYRLQTTEIVVAKSRVTLPSLTIMDGPFITILPYAGQNNHVLVYDAVNSIVHEETGYFYDDKVTYPSNWAKMVEKGSKYFPFMRDLQYVSSLRGSRPIPVNLKEEQDRHTRLRRYNSMPGFYSILEGKFISAPFLAQELREEIEKGGLLDRK